jgi:hypothetical protein
MVIYVSNAIIYMDKERHTTSNAVCMRGAADIEAVNLSNTYKANSHLGLKRILEAEPRPRPGRKSKSQKAGKATLAFADKA